MCYLQILIIIIIIIIIFLLLLLLFVILDLQSLRNDPNWTIKQLVSSLFPFSMHILAISISQYKDLDSFSTTLTDVFLSYGTAISIFQHLWFVWSLIMISGFGLFIFYDSFWFVFIPFVCRFHDVIILAHLVPLRWMYSNFASSGHPDMTLSTDSSTLPHILRIGLVPSLMMMMMTIIQRHPDGSL